MSAAAQAVEFGVCIGPPGEARAALLLAAGCDYYEPTVAKAIMAEDRAGFEAHVGEWTAGGLAPRAANVLLPGDLPIVGERADAGKLRAYLDEALSRAAALGIERVVFGSGTARNVPDGFPREQAYGQLREALRTACDAAGAETIVCLEHLRAAETNLVNRLEEAGDIVGELGLANLALVADAYHLAEEGEEVAVVAKVADKVAHVHVCGPARRPPTEADEPLLRPFFEQLAAIGYRGRCSIECNFAEVDSEAPAALDAVRRIASGAGLV
jgi:D-psicose/D-tagatose/L-ribulose 3-epimerase